MPRFRFKTPVFSRLCGFCQLFPLYKNTNYTVVIYGYIDLNDGNGFVRRAIGTASFATMQTLGIDAKWTFTGDISKTISVDLKLELQKESTDDSAQDDRRLAHALKELKEGQIALKLSRGSGPSRTLLTTAYLDQTSTITPEKLFTAGATLNEDTFNGLKLTPGDTYTIEVEKVSDRTYSMPGLGYINTFDVSVATRAQVITGQKTPPPLLSDPTQGVTAEPILNEEVANYGGKYDETLPDDAVVGYRLAANYDNSQYLGITVTYYPFEYGNFYRAIQGHRDPVDMQMKKQPGDPANHTVIDPITLNFAAGSTQPPKVALLFGGTEGESVGGEGKNFWNGYYSYYTGDARTDSSFLVGMGRGFRYVFAYTVEWSQDAQGSTQTYPYVPTNAYEEARDAYGAGRENGKELGVGEVYILNSGMKSVPRIAPEFHTYVNSTGTTSWTDSGESFGTLNIHYTWRDRDNTIIRETIGKNEATKLIYPTTGGQEVETPVCDGSRKVTPNPDGALDWYYLDVWYQASANGRNVVEPKVDLSLYGLDYTSLLNDLGIDLATEDFYLCHIPVEQAYDSKFGREESKDTPAYIEIEPHLNENYIDFILRDQGGSALSSDLGKRAYAIELKVQKVNPKDGNPNPQTLYLPIRSQLGLGYYARLASGALPADYVLETFEVDARVLYDTGTQGWKLIEDVEDEETVGQMKRNNFALQQIVKREDEPYRLGNYLNSGSAISGAYGAAVYQTGNPILTTSSIRGLVRNNERDDTSTGLSVHSISPDGWGWSWNVYPIQQGVVLSRYSKLEEIKAEGSCVVPKGVGYYTMTFVGGNNKCTLSQVTPTINKGTFATGKYRVDVYPAIYQILSHEQAGTETWYPTLPGGTAIPDSYVVHALLFADETTANQFVNNPADSMKGLAIKNSEVTVRLNTNGRPIEDEKKTENGSEVRVTGVIEPKDASGKYLLTENQTYYVVFYMKSKDGGSNLVLIDQTTAKKAVYPVQTAAGVVISSEYELNYQNSGYFNKSLVLNYGVNRSTGVTMEFELYDTDFDMANKTGTLIYNDKQMRDNKMLSASKTNLSTNANGNPVSINLTPSKLRERIKPGGTYYLYMKAYEGNEVAGEKVYSVNIPAVSNHGALIYVSQASKDSLAFKVSINDVGFSIMGHPQVENGKGLFAVRFTDGKGNWIPTVYDKEVYYADVPQQEFILKAGDGGTIEWSGYTMSQSDTYTLNIYAVKDLDHDGYSELAPITKVDSNGVVIEVTGEEERDYTGFFGGSGATKESAKAAFAAFLRQFWGSAGSGDASGGYVMNSETWKYEAGFRLAKKSQQLTGDDGVYVNKSKASIYRRGGKLVLTLSESFGLVSQDAGGNTVQAFKSVDWQIEGHYQNADGIQEPFMESRRSPTSANGTPIKKEQDVSGYDIYTYEIPVDVPTNGVYQVVVRLCRQAEGDNAGDVTLSAVIYG